MPRRSALRTIPRHALALKEYFGCGEASKICDKCDAFSTLGHSPKLSIENAPSNAPFSSHIGEASGCWPSVLRDRNSGDLRLCDFDCFLEDCPKVLSFVGAESSGDIFPDHPTGADVCTCSTSCGICTPHFFYNSDLLHKEPGPFTGKTGTPAGHRQVLARTAADDDIDGLHHRAVDLRYISQVFQW